METINDRMDRIVNEVFDGNKTAFAKTIDLPPTSMSSYLGNKRRSKPSVDMVAKIVQTLNVDARWLLTGEGDVSLQQSVVTGSHSAAAMGGGNATVNNTTNHTTTSTAACDEMMQQRLAVMQQLLDEKERVIAEKDRLCSEKERVIRLLLKQTPEQ